MYEFEINHSCSPAGHLPPDIVRQFADEPGLSAIALLPWEEHCTECAMPQCSSSCDLYEPRKDSLCRRFVNGIEVVEGVPNLLGYAVRISFKRWARLMCYGNLHLVPATKARTVLKFHRLISQWISRIPDGGLSIRGRRGVSSRLARQLKRRIFDGGTFAEKCGEPDFFLCQIYNPGSGPVPVYFGLRAVDGPLRRMPYQRLITVPPGFLRVTIPYREMAPHIDPQRMFTIATGPNIDAPDREGLVLYFGLMAFVKVSHVPAPATLPASAAAMCAPAPPAAPGKAKTVKVVAWDLDNTLWDGTLTEDGPEGVRLRENVASIVRELDRRGIVNSVVSKNDFEPAWSRIQAFGLDSYFVFPRISWEPKSQSVRSLVEDFSVGADSVAFIDDSPFERFEVQSGNPTIRVIDAAECDGLLALPEFNPPVSEESSQRRRFYQNEERRRQFQAVVSGDYRDFLRQCEIRIRIAPADAANLARAHELIQRTNQLNFSGNRYSRQEIEKIVSTPSLRGLCIFATDRFGDYGMVGFAILDDSLQHPRLIDLMFSCRIQAKRVEHAFLARLMQECRRKGAEHFEAVYRKTARNEQAGKVFEDLRFACVGQNGAEYIYGYDLRAGIPEDDIIEIDWL